MQHIIDSYNHSQHVVTDCYSAPKQDYLQLLFRRTHDVSKLLHAILVYTHMYVWVAEQRYTFQSLTLPIDVYTMCKHACICPADAYCTMRVRALLQSLHVV
jgi:hypothetical protein